MGCEGIFCGGGCSDSLGWVAIRKMGLGLVYGSILRFEIRYCLSFWRANWMWFFCINLIVKFFVILGCYKKRQYRVR